MSSSKTLFIIDESFKSEEKTLRITSLQNIFIKVIKTSELIENTSVINTAQHTKENPHE